MKLRSLIVACALSLTLFLFAARRQNSNGSGTPEFRGTVDLTHPISRQSTKISGSNFAREEFTQQFATTLQAPAIAVKGSWTVDQIPSERLIAPLVVIDVASKARRNADYQLSMEDVAEWEREHGNVPAGAIVIADTGWAAHWNSQAEYRNPDVSGDMHFPGISFEAARFLVEARSIFGLGIDTMSVDYGASRNHPVRRYTAAHGIYHLENVSNLDLTPKSGAIVIASPEKLQNSPEAPVRIVALLR